VKLADTPVYVVHEASLDERRARLESALAAEGIVADWVIGPAAPSSDRRYYRPSRWLWRRRTGATERIPFRRLTVGEISVGIKHVEALRRIATGDSDRGLILEDDAVFEEGFAARCDELFDELPLDADVVFLGEANNLRIPDVHPGQHFYRKENPATKGLDSYLVRRAAAAAVYPTILPFALPIDWELNYQLWRHGLVTYWLEPPLVRQGSEIGLYPSSLH
jgi:GR25 family glycosyltransferase involved in LPS biosynthesis